jgi:hypothetical protein
LPGSDLGRQREGEGGGGALEAPAPSPPVSPRLGDLGQLLLFSQLIDVDFKMFKNSERRFHVYIENFIGRVLPFFVACVEVQKISVNSYIGSSKIIFFTNKLQRYSFSWNLCV